MRLNVACSLRPKGVKTSFLAIHYKYAIHNKIPGNSIKYLKNECDISSPCVRVSYFNSSFAAYYVLSFL